MKLYKVIEILENFAPKDLAFERDNVGLMVGDPDSEIKKAVVSLDVSNAAIDYAVNNGCDLIVSHHPFIFALGKNMDLSDKLNKKIAKLIKNDISVYSMHTNFDSCFGGINDVLCEKLGLINYKPQAPEITRTGELDKEITLREFIALVKEKIAVNSVEYYGDLDKKIKKVTICSGGGADAIKYAADSDVFFTGELKYHKFEEISNMNIAAVAAGHFETENIAMYVIRDLLKNAGLAVDDNQIHNGFYNIM